MHSHVTRVHITNSAHAFKTFVLTFFDFFTFTLVTRKNLNSLAVVFGKFTRAYLHQIALEIMLLSILTRAKNCNTGEK